MSFTFGFYNALNHDRRYDAKEMSRIFDGLLTDGVYPTIGNKMMVRSSEEDNSVIVGSGRAWFNHSWNLNDADIPLTGPASHILYPRWDAVVLDINSSNEYRTNSIIWVTGTAASTPAKPAMIHTEDHNQYPLAYIYRISNNNAISDADITNTIGSDECPYAAGLLVDRKNIAQVEDNDYATKAYAFGEYIIWYDQLYKVTTPILKGVKIVAHPTSGYNVKSTMIATELYEKLVFDTVPTNGSQHAVTSDGIYKALGNHSSIQTTSSVTSGSGSLITSGGIYTALGNRTSIQTSAPTNGSNNLITSGQVYAALGNRASLPTAYSAPASGGTNLITNGQVYTALGNRTSIQTSAPASGGTNLITNGQVYTALGNRTKLNPAHYCTDAKISDTVDVPSLSRASLSINFTVDTSRYVVSGVDMVRARCGTDSFRFAAIAGYDIKHGSSSSDYIVEVDVINIDSVQHKMFATAALVLIDLQS